MLRTVTQMLSGVITNMTHSEGQRSKVMATKNHRDQPHDGSERALHAEKTHADRHRQINHIAAGQKLAQSQQLRKFGFIQAALFSTSILCASGNATPKAIYACFDSVRIYCDSDGSDVTGLAAGFATCTPSRNISASWARFSSSTAPR